MKKLSSSTSRIGLGLQDKPRGSGVANGFVKIDPFAIDRTEGAGHVEPQIDLFRSIVL
jgi:hypothetical protein